MFDFLSLKKSVSAIGAERRALQGKIEQKKRTREELTSAPITRDELADGLCQMIDAAGIAYPKRLATATEFLRNNPLHDFSEGSFDLIGTMGKYSEERAIPKGNIAWFMGDLMKKRVRDAVDAMDWPETSIKLTRQERLNAIEKLDREIVELEAQEQQIVEAAREAGLAV